MNKFFVYILVSFLSLLTSFFSAYIIQLIRIESGGGPSYFGPALSSAINGLILVVIFFLIIRVFSGRHFLNESWRVGLGFAFLDLIAWPAVIVGVVYLYAYLGSLGLYNL